MRTPRKGTVGMSLLELLVSVAMMAALALILASSFGAIGRALQRLNPAESEMALLLDRATLRRWIEDMPREAALTADVDTITFQTLIDDGLFWPGTLATVTLTQSEGTLVATATTPDVGSHPGHIRHILLSSDMSDLTIEVLSPAVGMPVSWQTAWPVGAGLPDLVRITYDIGARMAPPLTVMPARNQRYSVMSLSSFAPPG